jgi:hypothetical protein
MSAAAPRHGPAAPWATATPDWHIVAGGLVLCAAAIVFGTEITAISQINDWWLDEAFSLFVSEPGLGFSDALQHRILPDSNPPLYYVLLFAARRWIPDDRAAILALNGLAIGAAAVAVGLIGRRRRVAGFALAGFSAFLISGPVLRFAVEGRAYLLALMVTYVATLLSALALDPASPRPAWWSWTLLGVVAGLTHFFAGLFCGCLAAGLLLTSLTCRRRALIMPALALGIGSSATLIFWFLMFGYRTTGRLSWLVFSADAVAAAGDELRQTIFGAGLAAVACAAVFVVSLWVPRTRPLAILVGTTVALFFAVPCALCLAQPIIEGRYWLIGAPIVFVFLTFVARSALSEWRPPAGLRLRGSTCAGVVALLLVMNVGGFFAARQLTADLPFWKGLPLVKPLLAQCGPASIHVNWLPQMVAAVTHAPASLFVNVAAGAPAPDGRADPGCPILGWAEHLGGDDAFVDASSNMQLLNLLHIQASPADVTILRHRRGFVVLRAHG